MEFLDEVGTEYEGVPSLASGLFGISGVVVGSRRFYLARLKHADDYAGELERHATAA